MKKRIVIIGLALVLGLALAVALAARLRLDHLEGLYAPIFAAKGSDVYFVHRETRGVSWGLGYEHFSPPAHVYVFSDSFSLRRLDPEAGEVTIVQVLPASPFVGRHLRHYRGRLYGLPRVRLAWAENGGLEYTIALRTPRQPTAQTFGLRRRWNNLTQAMEETEDWSEGHFPTGGYGEDGVGQEDELLTPPGRQNFPAAIVRYRPVSSSYTTLLTSEGHNDLDASTPLLPWLKAHSRLTEVTRLRDFRATREHLIAQFRAQGLGEGDAILAANKEMQRLGYLRKDDTISARPIDEAERQRLEAEGVPLFQIADLEMQSGIFPDIERAIANPGTEVDKRGGAYLIHRDYDTSARLNAHLASGAGEFLVSYRDSSYILTIKRE